MAVGTRSYSNALLTQKLYDPSNLPDTVPIIKAFAYRVLEPTLICREEDCGTTIGRLLQVPESKPEGLIGLADNSVITDDDVISLILSGTYTIRARDTGSCLTDNGFCRNCGRGYLYRQGVIDSPELGLPMTFENSPRAYQNYIAQTFSGASMGWLPLASDPLPTIPDNWKYITNHGEMDTMCRLLLKLGVPRDDYDYMLGVEDILERALLIIGTYGVYGNV